MGLVTLRFKEILISLTKTVKLFNNQKLKWNYILYKLGIVQ